MSVEDGTIIINSGTGSIVEESDCYKSVVFVVPIVVLCVMLIVAMLVALYFCQILTRERRQRGYYGHKVVDYDQSLPRKYWANHKVNTPSNDHQHRLPVSMTYIEKTDILRYGTCLF